MHQGKSLRQSERKPTSRSTEKLPNTCSTGQAESWENFEGIIDVDDRCRFAAGSRRTVGRRRRARLLRSVSSPLYIDFAEARRLCRRVECIRIQRRQKIGRQCSVPRSAAYRAGFGFRGNLCTTASTKSSHISRPLRRWSYDELWKQKDSRGWPEFEERRVRDFSDAS